MNQSDEGFWKFGLDSIYIYVNGFVCSLWLFPACVWIVLTFRRWGQPYGYLSSPFLYLQLLAISFLYSLAFSSIMQLAFCARRVFWDVTCTCSWGYFQALASEFTSISPQVIFIYGQYFPPDPELAFFIFTIYNQPIYLNLLM